MIPIGNNYLASLVSAPYSACVSRNVPDRESSAQSAVAAFVRARRKANRLSQRELAELAGVGVRFVSELERGKPTLRVDAVNSVLAVFGKRLGVIDAPRTVDEPGEPAAE